MKSLCLKTLLLSLILLFSINGNVSSQRVGSWKTYMAFHDATMVAETNTLVFGIYNGSLLSYDPEYDEIITYGFPEGLSDVDITMIKYIPDYNALVIIYKNCNIDIFYGPGDVLNLPFIKDETLDNKEFHNIDIIGDYVYLTAGFGIVVLDLKQKVVKETYKLDMPVKAICKIGDYLYAATTAGFKKGLMSLNLIDKALWEDVGKEELDYPGTLNNIRKMLLFKDQLVIQEISRLYYQNKAGEVIEWIKGTVRDLMVMDDLLIVAAYDRIYFYTDFGNRKQQYMALAHHIDSHNSPDKFWLACGEEGIVQISMDIDSGDSQVLASGITVDSPLVNSCFYVTYTQDKLLVTGGGKLAERFKNAGALMVLENGRWTNISHKEVEAQLGMEEGTCRDFIKVVVDPNDPNHYFVGSWGEGVYEFQDNVCINLFDESNSSLRSALGNGKGYYRVDGLAFDQQGDLYTLSDEVENGLSIFSAGRTWSSFYYPPLSNELIDMIYVDRNNRKWINKRRAKNQSVGIMVLDDDQGVYYYSTHFQDQQGETLGATAYNCIAEDRNGYIWVGTDLGPIYFTSYEDIQNGRCNRRIGTDQYNEGYRLLDGVDITTMAIDGGNRKWFGTKGSGVYMVDDSGSSFYVENYTTDNSLLISDQINSIAINDRTGEVFIATDKGLMSYQSDAVEGSPDYSNVYAYPNPIYPDRQGGGVVITGLMGDSSIKITDMAGNLIAQGTSIGGMYRWNCTDTRGETVKSGIYLVFAAQEDGSTGVVTKIMVIR